jgi:hypothetical protein
VNRLVTPDQGAHWYTRNGSPLYTVPKKDGTGERNTTLADARKLDLVPSVTGIISIIAKPGLEAWKTEQALLSALTLPRIDGEADQDFAKRAIADSKEYTSDAADLGSEVHQYIEDYLRGNDPRLVPGVEASCASVKDWIEQNIEKPGNLETPFASRLGYGGRIDWFGTMKDGKWAVIDWKTQNVKTAKGPTFYETYDLQLAAYANAIDEMNGAMGVGWIDRRISVVISSNPAFPGCWSHEWAAPTFKHFLSALDLWIWQNNYDPRSKA